MMTTLDTNNVVERLRDVRVTPLTNGWPAEQPSPHALCLEAADLIQSLSERIDVLRDGLEQLEGKARLGGDCLGNSPPEFIPCQKSFYLLADLARASLTQGGK